MTRLGTTLATALALLLVPSSALAAVVEVRPAGGSERVLSIDDDIGEANDLAIRVSRTQYEFEVHDAAAPLLAGAGCDPVDLQTVSCPVDAVRRVDVKAGSGDDRVVDVVPPVPGSSVYHVQIDGGEGDDELIGSRVDEGFVGGPGADYVSGGRGIDTVTVDGNGTGGGVRVTLDAQPNDGLEGEGDNIRGNVEHIVGGPGPDTLIGHNGAHHMSGAGGNDRLVGKGGDDFLAGGAGADVLEGGAGSDRLGAVDRTSADTAICGNGWDDAWGDVGDRIGGDCENFVVAGVRYRHQPTAASGRPPGLPALVAPTVLVRGRSVVVIVGCRRGAACFGPIKVTASIRPRRGAAARSRTLARGYFRARARRMVVVRLRMRNRLTRRQLRRIRRGTVTLSAVGDRGGSAVTRRRVRLR